MTDRPPQTPGSATNETGAQPQATSSSNWHFDGLQQRRLRRQKKQARSPLHFPRWSLALMLLIVLLATAAVTAAVISLRGDAPGSATAPVIRITRATGLDTFVGIDAPATAADTSDGVEIVIAVRTPASLEIDGPVLPTVVITLTPVPLTLGAEVEVVGVGDQQLNVRNQASLIDSAVLFRAPEGTIFQVVGGPHQADGFTWWQLRDIQFQVEGWAVANYLQVTR